jgi:hypothetical protein
MTPPVAHTGTQTGTSRALAFSRLLRVAPPFLVLTLSAGRLLWIVQTYSVNVFVGDQWLYNEPTLFHRQSAWNIFRWQSTPWRQGLGGLLSAVVGPPTHWNSRDESFISAGLIIAGCVLALYLSARLKGEITAWDSLIPLFALSPIEYQSVVGVTHYSHGPLPFLLIIAFCLTWTIRRYALKYGLALIIAFLCTYTGFGVFIGVLCPLVICSDFWARRSSADKWETRACIMSLIISILSLTSFFYGFTFADGVCPPHAFSDPGTGLAVRYPNPLHYFLFLAFMFGDFVGLKATISLVPSILGGSAVLILVLVALFFGLRRRPLLVVPIVLITYSLMFAGATARGRMCLGLGAALGSRYMIYLAPAFIGMYLLATTCANNVARPILLAILAGLALLSSLTVHRSDRDDMAEFHRLRLEWKQCYLAEHDLVDCNRKSGATPYSYPDTIQDRIDYLEQKHLNFYSDQPDEHQN